MDRDDRDRCAPPTLVQNTARPFSITATSDGTLDLTFVVSAYLLVHRGGGALERWTTTLVTGATPYRLTLLCTPLGAVPGVQAVTLAGETLRLRPYLHFASGPDVECEQTTLQVVEA